jgi:mannose-6-phosphate isomerase-like protein (cupin superfamily)
LSDKPNEEAVEMKLFKREDFTGVANKSPGQLYRQKILTGDDMADDLEGIFVLIPPGVEGQFHYHVKRESVQIFVSGEAVGCFEDREIPVAAGDVLYIPPREKHRISNRSNVDVRFLEFFTQPPVESDLVPVE